MDSGGAALVVFGAMAPLAVAAPGVSSALCRAVAGRSSASEAEVAGACASVLMCAAADAGDIGDEVCGMVAATGPERKEFGSAPESSSAERCAINILEITMCQKYVTSCGG